MKTCALEADPSMEDSIKPASTDSSGNIDNGTTKTDSTPQVFLSPYHMCCDNLAVISR